MNTTAPGTITDELSATAISTATAPAMDSLDDVFGSAPASPVLAGDRDSQDIESATRLRVADPSDIPRLRSTHVTNGYREGIAVSKEKYVQDGFDEGFGLGAEIGVRAGWCLGILYALVKAVVDASAIPERPATVLSLGGEASAHKLQSRGGAPLPSTSEGLRRLLAKAEAELQVQRLFGPEFFGEDGIWTYDTYEKEEDIAFAQVADAHPLIQKWTGTVRELTDYLGLDIANR